MTRDETLSESQKGCKRNFNCQSENVVVIQISQINLTFLVLGFFFLDTKWLESVRGTSQWRRVVRLLWINLPFIASASSRGQAVEMKNAK